MGNMVGTISRGIRTPIIRSGDNLVKMVADSVIEAAKDEGFEIKCYNGFVIVIAWGEKKH